MFRLLPEAGVALLLVLIVWRLRTKSDDKRDEGS